jgi:outer membrane protein OmpA-like peptidoglycan-associated protein
VLTADKKELIFTKRDGFTVQYDEDLYVSEWKNGSWQSPESISRNINSSYNEGTCTISADGRILIFTSCERNTYGTCDLFISYKNGEDWTYPENMGPAINSTAWESQATLSADGRKLYFISTRRGGKGKRDIWYSTLDEYDEWTEARNLGSEINTPYDEVSPFIHVNGQTLFFASNGYPGFGGFDMYSSELEDGKWSEPKNLGYPLNTHNDEVSLFITADGRKGFYSFESFDVEGKQRSLLYNFGIDDSLGITYTSNYVYGKVYDQENKHTLSATIELYDINKDTLVSRVKSDPVNGEYLIVLTDGAEYALHTRKKGYLFESQSFNYLSEHDTDPIEQNIYLKRAISGSRVVLNNIYFDFDSYDLREKSKTEIKQIKRFLTENPEIKIEIAGHTDNRGSAEYNKRLSEQRAKSVYNFLTTNLGVPEDRISFRGYGQSEPVAANDSEENMQLNRRIEFKVL